ncbi:MAG TPA: ATP-binding protein [Aeromicrobium sp.]|nr:ATP-binding protein [Aeromicrobium sp.]
MSGPLGTLGLAVALVAATAALKLSLYLIDAGNAGYVIYIPAVAFAAWYRGLGAGAFATLLAVVMDMLVFELLIPGAAGLPDQEIRLLAFVAASLLLTYFSYRLRTDRDAARNDAEKRSQALSEAAQARQEVDRVVSHERRANELRDAFNSIVSHELRTPITSIYGGAKLLASRERVLDDHTRRELIDDLEVEADRLYRLVEDLLVLARSERGTVERVAEPILLSRMVARVVRSEQERWPASKFEVSAKGSEATARGDETYVEQVIRNLVSNAAKYSPAGSVVRVIVDGTSEGIRLRVLDEGAGIDADEAPRLFDLYYRSPHTARMVSGAGIGLYVCRVLISAMGGRIWGLPRPEGGAEFGFVLQRAEEDPVSGETVAPSTRLRTVATAARAG